MTENRRYYYLKLKEYFFNSERNMTFSRPEPNILLPLVKKIGKTTHLVWTYFSETSIEMMEDRIKQILRKEVRQIMVQA